MRITDIYLKGFGPFQGDEVLHLDTNDERVLFLGISGSGKTTVLRGIAAMWLELKRCKENKKPGYTSQGSVAMVVQGEWGSALISLGSKALLETLLKLHKDAWWLYSGPGGFETAPGAFPPFSNLCLLDGDMEDGPSSAPFFITDGDVKGFAKGTAKLSEKSKQELIGTINRLWVGKTLADTPNGFKVRLASGYTHSISEASMGERRILGLCYLACTQLQEGGILLMDEPDIHVHPSQLMGLISTLEQTVLKKGGQVMLISHHSDVWNRYDLIGKVVVMGGAHERIG